MKYKKSLAKEEGYLLLESLLTITILITITIALCPLIINWLSNHQEAKSLVEENRQLYESSIILNNQLPHQQTNERYTIQLDKTRIQINETGTEVIIYESVFKK